MYTIGREHLIAFGSREATGRYLKLTASRICWALTLPPYTVEAEPPQGQ
jgi:hypothetical protein